MRIIAVCVVSLALMVSVACAKEQVFTGNEYLKLNAKQRIAVVSKMINNAGDAGIAIQYPPKFYCESLDAAYSRNPAMRPQPFAQVFKTLIIMEYDWDQRGVDKDELARRTLGEAAYKSNKARLGMK